MPEAGHSFFVFRPLVILPLSLLLWLHFLPALRGASMPDTGPGSAPRSNSGATNDDAAAAADDDDDDDDGGGGGELSQTGSFRAC